MFKPLTLLSVSDSGCLRVLMLLQTVTLVKS